MSAEHEQTPPDGSTDRWFTPRPVWEPYQAEFGFTWDVTYDPEAPWSQAIGRGWGIEDDSLARDWPEGEIYGGNIPFSDPDPWAPHVWEQAKRWKRSICGLIYPSRTDRPWWLREIEPYRDLPAGQVRPVLDNLKGHQTIYEPRPWATLEVRNIRRVNFGFPGAPEAYGPNRSKGAKRSAAFVWCSLLIWRPAVIGLSQNGFEKSARAGGRPRAGNGSAQVVAARVAELESQLKARTRGHYNWTGEAVKRVAGELGVSLATVYRRLAEAGKAPRGRRSNGKNER